MKLTLLLSLFSLNILRTGCFELDLNEFSELLSSIGPDDLNLDHEQLMSNYRASIKEIFPAIDPEAFMNVTEIIKYHGYPVEEHIVETNDGWILEVQRIPFGKNGPTLKPRKPVLIQHGLFCSSVVWVTNTPDKNLAYILADAGYDVWLGNVRGTVSGYKNTKYSPEDIQFWEFSFDEMASEDLTAVIQTMLNVTKFQQIYYVGHSMGTTMLFALLSSKPEYNEIIKAGFTLAPVTLPHNIQGAFALISHFAGEVQWLFRMLGIGKFALPRKMYDFFARTICDSPIRVVCENVMFVLAGFDYSQMNATRLPVQLYHTPDATSLQNVIHFAQLMKAEHFQKYDFGEKYNPSHYNQTTPPIYDLSNVTAPIAIFWAQNDYLADPPDVNILVSKLKNVPLVYQVNNTKFNHLDFMWAIDVKPLLYNKLLSVMNKLWK